MCSMYRFYGQIIIGCIAIKATKYYHITQLKQTQERVQKDGPPLPLFSKFSCDCHWLQIILICMSSDEFWLRKQRILAGIQCYCIVLLREVLKQGIPKIVSFTADSLIAGIEFSIT